MDPTLPRQDRTERRRSLAPLFRGALLPVLFIAGIGCGEGSVEPGHGPADSSQRATGSLNLLLITLDTTRADALGAYGQRLPSSPAIDRLAATGVLFEQATATHPETLPSHASIFTGRWPHVHGVRANAGYVLADENLTLAEVLRSHGYKTAAEVATGVLRRETLITQGFESYRGADSPGVELKQIRFEDGRGEKFAKQMRVGSDITARGIDFLRAEQKQKFFLWLHYYDAHDPYSAPARFNHQIPESPYHAEVASQDFQVGRLIAELVRLGLRANTLVVLTADHGEGLDEHGEPSHSYFVYQTTMHVPLIFWGLEGLPAGKRVASMVRTVDIVPSVLDLLGLSPIPGIQGKSLVRLLRGETEDLQLTAYGEASRFTASFGLPLLRYLRQGDWKYIHKVNPELYDVARDPAEIDNLASRHPEELARLRDELETLIGDAPPGPVNSEQEVDRTTAAQLVALGYAAQSPAGVSGDPLASLVLEGADPSLKIEEARTLSVATGLIDRGSYEGALSLLEPIYESDSGNTYVQEIYFRVLVGLGRNDEAAALMRKILVNRPCKASVRGELGRLLFAERRFEELRDSLREAATHCPSDATNLNDYAWALATLPVASLRNGDESLEIMQVLVGRQDEPNPFHLDTLAVAQAETGDFASAIRTGERALHLMRSAERPKEIVIQLEQHLEAYRAGRPVRDPGD